MPCKKGSIYVTSEELIRRIVYWKASGLTQAAWLRYIKVKDVNQVGRAMHQLKSRNIPKEEINDKIQFWVDDIQFYLESPPTDRDEFLMWYEEIIKLGLNAQEVHAGLIKYLNKNDINVDWYFNMLRGYEFFRYCISIMSPEDANATMNSGVNGKIILHFNYPKNDDVTDIEGEKPQVELGGSSAEDTTPELISSECSAGCDAAGFSGVTTSATGVMEDAEEDVCESNSDNYIYVSLSRYNDREMIERTASVTIPLIQDGIKDTFAAIDNIVRAFMELG